MPRIFEYIVDAVRRPSEQLSRGQHFVRYSWDLAVHCYRQLERHRAEGMAAELTYRTIFALIPVVVLGLVMFRVFGGLEEVQSKVENQLYSFFGVPDTSDAYSTPFPDEANDVEDVSTNADFVIQGTDATGDETPTNGLTNDPADGLSDGSLTEDGLRDASPQESPQESPGDNGPSDGAVESDPAKIAAAGSDPTLTTDIEGGEAGDDIDPEELRLQREATEAEMGRSARANIRRTLSEVTAKVASVDFASIGVFGLLLFIYAAVALADATEYLFNRIYEAPTQRPIHIRVAIHWSIITLGSGLLAMSLYMSGQVIDWLGAGVGIRTALSHLVAIAASWVLLFLLYALMPNTHVSVRAAAIGSMVAALFWEAAKYGFQIYVTKAVPYSAIYGSIGLIPLFLFWIYVTWLIVLFGLILTYTLQSLRGRRLVRGQWEELDMLSGDPDWMLPIMAEVAHSFADGEAVDNQNLADRLGLSSRITLEMIAKLVDAKLLRRVSTGAGEEDTLTLARPAEKIPVTDILALAHHSRPTSNHPAWATLAGLKKAERAAAAGVTLADIALSETNGER